MEDEEANRVEIELLKDRMYNLEQYMKSVTEAIQRWSEKVANRLRCEKGQ